MACLATIASRSLSFAAFAAFAALAALALSCSTSSFALACSSSRFADSSSSNQSTASTPSRFVTPCAILSTSSRLNDFGRRRAPPTRCATRMFSNSRLRRAAVRTSHAVAPSKNVPGALANGLGLPPPPSPALSSSASALSSAAHATSTAICFVAPSRLSTSHACGMSASSHGVRSSSSSSRHQSSASEGTPRRASAGSLTPCSLARTYAKRACTCVTCFP
mmetsp:Transcript_4814/g.10768  ORF Transcript_4814/g.10768 Transcript_4814/m.10768 type:complete len:221 (-) Transcript_4814:58-720(-)